MKKILCSVLCLMLALFMLVGCGEDAIGGYIDQYEKPTEKELLTYNLYIICEDGTSDDAKTVVRRRISDYTEKSALKTNLNVVFCSASEYDSVIKKATDPKTSYSSNESLTESQKAGKIPQADIILITSAAMMDYMVEEKRVADLSEFLNGDYEYGKFNAQIATSLLNAALIENKYYAIPNNYVVGEYTYLSVNIAEAAKYYFSERDIQSNKAEIFGTEYFWILASALGVNPADLISEVTDSQLNHSDLIYYEHEIFTSSEVNADGDTVYSYLFVNKNASEEHKVSYENITTIAQAREKYQTNADKSVNIPKEKFDLIFKELVTTSALSSGDEALLKAASDNYFSRIEFTTEDGKTLSDYIFFDKQTADSIGLNDNAYFEDCNLIENTPVVQLWNKIAAAGDEPADYIKLVKGAYDLKFAIEAGDDVNGRNICNVLQLPTATRDDAFAGAFAVNTNVKDVERAMEVIYAINNDKTLHNYLQYGIAETNYKFVGEDKEDGIIERSDDDTTRYIMNHRYTGNLFGIYYCEAIDWMPENLDSAKKQNDESIYKP